MNIYTGEESGTTPSFAIDLSIDDLGVVNEASLDARIKWYEIGLELGISPDTLNAIKEESQSNSGTCLRNTLMYWLQNSTNRNWRALANAMSSRTVGRQDIADRILQKHAKNLS